MTTNSVTSATATQPASSAVSKGFDPNEFMSIMIAELQNQDPLKGVNMTDFLNQFSTLINLQQTNSLNTTIGDLAKGEKASQAYALIGKTIEATDANGSPVNGKVSGVALQDGSPQLSVGDQDVPLSNVTSVTT